MATGLPTILPLLSVRDGLALDIEMVNEDQSTHPPGAPSLPSPTLSYVSVHTHSVLKSGWQPAGVHPHHTACLRELSEGTGKLEGRHCKMGSKHVSSNTIHTSMGENKLTGTRKGKLPELMGRLQVVRAKCMQQQPRT
eukprot:453059-Pelagomonas_calceolata.AAC.1